MALAVLVPALVLGAGCRAADRSGAVRSSPSPSPGLASAGTTSRTIVVDGRERAFRLHRPAAPPAALVVMLHGGFGSARQAEAQYGWNELADRQGFAVVYPDGLDRAWNVGGGCCGRSAATGVDDVAFIRAVVAAVRPELAVDPGRVYATGMSNGGMLAYRLACDTDLFAAVGPVAATLLGPCPSPAPVSVIHVHGSADRRVRYDGAPGEGVGRIDGVAVPDLIATWRGVDRCDPPTAVTDGANNRSEATCPDGRGVTLVTVAGAGHEWPGDTTATIWRFFLAHPAT
jgi:polyhydroxybutyrate depolymerase